MFYSLFQHGRLIDYSEYIQLPSAAFASLIASENAAQAVLKSRASYAAFPRALCFSHEAIQRFRERPYPARGLAGDASIKHQSVELIGIKPRKRALQSMLLPTFGTSGVKPLGASSQTLSPHAVP